MWKAKAAEQITGQRAVSEESAGSEEHAGSATGAEPDKGSDGSESERRGAGSSRQSSRSAGSNDSVPFAAGLSGGAPAGVPAILGRFSEGVSGLFGIAKTEDSDSESSSTEASNPDAYGLNTQQLRDMQDDPMCSYFFCPCDWCCRPSEIARQQRRKAFWM